MSARDKEVDGHWDNLDRSSSTSSSRRVSWTVPGSCREITIALVLSARNMRWRHRSRAWLTSCRAFDTPHGACRVTSPCRSQNQLSVERRAYLSSTHHCLVIVLTHGDGLLRGHHVPQTIAPQDDVTVFLGVESYHASVRFRRNHELPAVEVIAPKISCFGGNTLNKTTAHMITTTQPLIEYCSKLNFIILGGLKGY